KEEAVMLPLILSGWAWVLSCEDDGRRGRVREVIRTWPTWLALAIYLALRAQTAAMTPMTATSSYQFVRSPGALVGNALEYLDRACTFSVLVVLIAHILAWRVPTVTPAIRRPLTLGAFWFIG